MKSILSVFMFLGLSMHAFGQTVVLKNFRQISASLSYATGVLENDAAVKDKIAQVKGRLPQTGAVAELASPVTLAMIELSTAFCRKMIALDAAQTDPAYRHVHKSVDFTGGIDGLNADVRQSVAKEYSGIFWGRAPTANELSLLTTAMSDAMKSEASNENAVTAVLLTGCIATASSVENLVY